MKNNTTTTVSPQTRAARQRAIDMIPELTEFMREHGMLPRAGGGKTSNRLYTTLRRLRGMEADGVLPKDQVEKLDGAYASWRGVGNRDMTWADKFTETRAYVAEHGEFPTSASAGEALTLARWLDDQIRYGRGAVPMSRQIALDVGLPGWDGRYASGMTSVDHAFERRTEEYATFTEINGGAPQQRATALERRLARWGAEQRRKHRLGTLPAHRVEMLETRMPDFFLAA